MMTHVKQTLGLGLVVLASAAAAAPARAEQYVLHARPGMNSLAKGFPTRGFGDSNQVDVWVPFHFSGGVLGQISRATIVAVVKPIGQLIGTDGLALKGASGKVHWISVNFERLRANQWNRLELDITGNADVLAAIQKGYLEGVIQDDSAVQSVTLVVEGGRKQVAVYAYDVYSWSWSADRGQNAWVHYQSFWSAEDANRVAQHWRGRGYHMHVAQRFWRWGNE